MSASLNEPCTICGHTLTSIEHAIFGGSPDFHGFRSAEVAAYKAAPPELCPDCDHAVDDHDRRAEDGSCDECRSIARSEPGPCANGKPVPA